MGEEQTKVSFHFEIMGNLMSLAFGVHFHGT